MWLEGQRKKGTVAFLSALWRGGSAVGSEELGSEKILKGGDIQGEY